ncbi:hypothetical protein DFH08DRAFT_822486 [Mycena albidolilacea]|uniref:Uncharacterized protein n=1 Tax=Mycena albidolilacea TaxID=1033008 RepID=A0AAD6Z872_9AGAR|nr:hypothetical protein DFH08DRAFT_822486 [Mycena albidolilacea]
MGCRERLCTETKPYASSVGVHASRGGRLHPLCTSHRNRPHDLTMWSMWYLPLDPTGSDAIDILWRRGDVLNSFWTRNLRTELISFSVKKKNSPTRGRSRVGVSRRAKRVGLGAGVMGVRREAGKRWTRKPVGFAGGWLMMCRSDLSTKRLEDNQPERGRCRDFQEVAAFGHSTAHQITIKIPVPFGKGLHPSSISAQERRYVPSAREVSCIQ